MIRWSGWVKLLNWFLAGILLVLIVHGIELAHATDRGDPVTVTTDTSLVGGNTSQLVGGDSHKALGLGFSYALGDVDLNEGQNCYVSTAKGNIIFGRQKVELNPWCAAMFYDANKMHVFAAVMRCSIEQIDGQYLNNEECIIDQTIAPEEIVASPALTELYGRAAQFVEDESEHQAQLEDLEQQVQQQQQQYDELAARRSRPRPTQSAAELYWTDERRAKLEAIKGEQ